MKVERFTEPYVHSVIDDFFPEDAALKLESEFPPYHDGAWYSYNNAIEKKKTLNLWHMFPAETYKAFQGLCAEAPAGAVADYGLHGGGWHIMQNGGNLNPHVDYDIHPKLGMYRKWNLIVYLSSDYKEEYGGHFGFWKDNHLVKTIAPIFNRAVLFRTEGAVHGLADTFSCPEGVYRKSIAVYYVGEEGAGENTRAQFYPRPGQGADVEALIERRKRGEYK